MKYSVITFGCRVNQADSLAIEGSLRARGAICASPDEADLVVVNTCSVTAAADQGARQTIRRIARSNSDVQIVVTGCYATRRPGELRDLSNVTHVVSNRFKDELLTAIESSEPSLASTASRYGDGDGSGRDLRGLCRLDHRWWLDRLAGGSVRRRRVRKRQTCVRARRPIPVVVRLDSKRER